MEVIAFILGTVLVSALNVHETTEYAEQPKDMPHPSEYWNTVPALVLAALTYGIPKFVGLYIGSPAPTLLLSFGYGAFAYACASTIMHHALLNNLLDEMAPPLAQTVLHTVALAGVWWVICITTARVQSDMGTLPQLAYELALFISTVVIFEIVLVLSVWALIAMSMSWWLRR